MRAAGISDDSIVVAYDDDAGANASRLVWLLRATGHEAAVLDGGITAWTGELSTDGAKPAPGTFTAAPWPADKLVGIDALEGVLVDARNAERFRGEVEPVDPRPGHIPGAVSIPCRQNVGPDGRL